MTSVTTYTVDDGKEFYPTPISVCAALWDSIPYSDSKLITTVLEPSAGKGDICDYVADKVGYNVGRSYPHDKEGGIKAIDCIELDANLRHILKGKGYRVVGDDFLSYDTAKRYDLIILNPPFSNGDKHLLKALDMQRDGGIVACVLNAETLKNPYTNTRKELSARLSLLNAKITFVANAFWSAERKAEVEVALITVVIPRAERRKSVFFERAEKAQQAQETEAVQRDELTEMDFVRQIINQYKCEVRAICSFLEEYNNLLPYLSRELVPAREEGESDEEYRARVGYVSNDPFIVVSFYGGNETPTINGIIRRVRLKYWQALFSRKEIVSGMPSQMVREHLGRVEELADYEFSEYNIRELISEMSREFDEDVVSSIDTLFDKLTADYCYFEGGKNIHYYNGWCSNKAHKVARRIVAPFWSGWDEIWNKINGYRAAEFLSDVEKVLNYLDDDRYADVDVARRLDMANATGQTRDIQFKYFSATFYKKGTVHLTFTALDVLDKLNIFIGKKRKWLPPAYGKVDYNELDADSKRIVDEFQGSTAYAAVRKDAGFYLAEPKGVELPRLIG